MKKRILAILLTLSMVCSMLPTVVLAAEPLDATYWVHESNVATGFAGGDGSEEHPYEIGTADQLAYLSQVVGQAWSYDAEDEIEAYAGAYYVLTADIDLGGKEWTPIEGEYDDFAGGFDGQNHKISNMTITKSVSALNEEQYYAGLFGEITNGVVQNIEFVNVSITKNDSINEYAGVVAGRSNGTILNITVTSGAVEGGSCVGGIVGGGYGLISGCTNKASVTNEGSYGDLSTSGWMRTGGIVGNFDGQVRNCTNEGTVTLKAVEPSGSYRSGYIGGIVGDASGEAVQNCANLGAVTVIRSGEEYANGRSYCIGGIVGMGDVVANCYNKGEITYDETQCTDTYDYAAHLGGIAGRTDEVYNCYNTGTTDTGRAMEGYSDNGNTADVIANCYWISTQTPADASDDCKIEGCGTFAEGNGALTAYSGNTLVAETLVDALNGWTMVGYSPAGWVGTDTDLGFADPVAVSGIIENSAGALSGAKVTINGTTVTTDDSGAYTISNVPAGNYTVLVRAEGCVDASFLITVGGENATADAKLFNEVPLSYEISSVDQLAALASTSNIDDWEVRDTVDDHTFTLTENLDLSGYYWNPIGATQWFSGSFDGGDHSITGLYVNLEGEHAGLFGELTTASADTTIPFISDLTLINPTVYGTENAGALCGSTYGDVTVTNVTVTGGTVYGLDYAGGIVGYHSGDCIVSNCSNGADVTGNIAGGVAGGFGIVLSSSNSGTVTAVGTDAIAGGITGDRSDVDNCINTGDVYSDKYAGGLAGVAGWEYLRNSYNSGNVHLTGSGFAGGLLSGGINTSGQCAENSYNTGDVSAPNGDSFTYVGGLMGMCSDNTINNCYSTGTVTGDEGNVGNLTGDNAPWSTAYFVDGDTDLSVLLTNLNTWVADNADNGSYMGWVADADNYPTFAPKITVSGTLTNQHGDGAEGATVTLYNAAGAVVGSATADADGEYAIENVSMGNYTIELGGNGYATPRIIRAMTESTTLDVKVIALESITPSSSNYEVETIGQLAWVAAMVGDEDYNGFYEKTITLQNGLDLTGYYWYPIGNVADDTDYSVAFSGTFDGNDQIITGLTIANDENYQGLFGNIGNPESGYYEYNYEKPEIKDLTIRNANITAKSAVGALAGNAEGSTIINITVDASQITATDGFAAGMIGTVDELYPFDGCSAEISQISVENTAVVGTDGAAGIIAQIASNYNSSVTLDNLTMAGSVQGGSHAGGVLGYVEAYTDFETTATNIMNRATVAAEYAAGICYGASGIEFQNLTNYGEVTAISGTDTANAAGLILGGENLRVYNAANFADVTSTGYYAPVSYGIGVLHESQLYNSFNQGDVIATCTNDSAEIKGTVVGMAFGSQLVMDNNYTCGTLTGAYRYPVTNGFDDDLTVTNSYVSDGGDYETLYIDGADVLVGTKIDEASDLLTDLNTWVNENVTTFEGVTLANWQIASDDIYPTYAVPATVTYDANGATDGTVPDSVTTGIFVGGTFTVADNTGLLEKDDYEFAGWSTAPTATQVYKAGESLILPGEAVTLYARWATGIENATITPAETYVYDTEEQEISFSVSVDNVTLTKDTDYEIATITYGGEEVTEILDAGDYTYTVQGIGIYTGQVSKVIAVEQATITKDDIVSTDYAATKVYDGEETAPETYDEAIATNVEGLTVEVTALSEYDTSTAGDNRQLTLTLGAMVGDDASNYKLDEDLTENGYGLTNAVIETFVITQVAKGTLQFSKTYNGLTDVSGASGTLELQNAQGEKTPTAVTVDYTDATYDSAGVGTDKTVTLTVTELNVDAYSTNYSLELIDSEFDVPDCIISAATPGLQLPTVPQLKVGSGLTGLAAVVTGTVSGANGETPTGTLAFFLDGTYETPLTDGDLTSLTIGATPTIYYTFTLDSQNTVNANYTDENVQGSFVLKIVDGDPQIVTFASATQVKTYGDDAFAVVPTVADEDGDPITNGGAITYESSNEDVATVAAGGTVTIVGAGSANITATAEAVAGQWAKGEQTYVLTVNPKTPTADDFVITVPGNTVYTGDEVGATVVAKIEIAGMGEVTVRYNGETVLPTDVDTYTVTFDVAAGDNYAAATGLEAGEFDIIQAAAPTLTTMEQDVYYATAQTGVTVDLTAVVGLPTDAGTITYAITDTVDDSAVLNGAATIAEGSLSFDTNAMTTDGDTVIITVEVTMDNYETATFTVEITTVDKTQVTITGVEVADKTYDGTAVSYTGTAIGDNDYDGTFEYTWDTTEGTAPVDAGDYTLTVSIPEDHETHMGSVDIDFTIETKEVTVQPKDFSIYTNGTMPTFALAYETMVTGETATPSVEPSFTLTDGEGAEVTDTSKNGTYTITWSNMDAASFTDGNYTFIKEATGTLTISTRPVSGGGTMVEPTPEPEINTEDGNATASIPAITTVKGDTATAMVDTDVLIQTVDDTVRAMDEAGVANVEIIAEVDKAATKVAVQVSAQGLTHLAESQVENLTISSEIGTLTISSEAAQSIAEQAGETGNVVITVGQVETVKELNAKQQETIGDAPVFDLLVTANGKPITNFDGGFITVSFPYQLQPGQNPSGVRVWYLDENGNVENMNGKYDVATGEAVFTTTHFSYYAVSYVPFDDVDATDWFYQAVLWAVDNEITKGTSAAMFSPDASCTRAQAVTFLYRAAGQPEVTGDCVFTDVNANSDYYDAVRWAVAEGITAGTSATTFSPDDVCTRGQIVTFLYRSAGEPAVEATSVFSDVESESYCYDAVRWAVSENITNGTGDSTFSPDENCTRGQIVTFLYRNMAD